MSYRLLDFADIVDAVMEELKVQSADTISRNRIKRDVNMIYLNEVVPFKRWFWLRGNATVEQQAYYGEGTVSVTPGSAAITLSLPPAESKAGQYFAVDGFQEIYKIATHEAGSADATLDMAYNGSRQEAANFKVWTDTVPLPTSCREVLEAWHDYRQDTLRPVGIQEFRKTVAESPRFEDRPYMFTVSDFIDPSAADGETESDRYRALKVYPAVCQYDTPIKVDHIVEATPLDLDGDEPLMPVNDRIVLFYGACSRAWSRERNPEEAARNQALFQQKLAHMSGNVDEGDDKPQITPSSKYMASKRGGRIGRYRGAPSMGGASYAAPQYLSGVTIVSANLTGDITAEVGVLVDGRDISEDGVALDALIASVGTIEEPNRAIISDAEGALTESEITTSELSYLDDVTDLTTVTVSDNSTTVIEAWPVATFDNFEVFYTINRGAGNIEAGRVTIVTDGVTAEIAQGGIADLGTLGVDLSVDVDGTDVRLIATATSTGIDARMKYKAHKWVS